MPPWYDFSIVQLRIRDTCKRKINEAKKFKLLFKYYDNLQGKKMKKKNKPTLLFLEIMLKIKSSQKFVYNERNDKITIIY